ncbi:AUGMIN subunit 6-like [Silene latifolia]|uniref:AUGMIN subunit 6-like n=1 Tax=Silene latifolia TaxID=37657 RepID=UPI003D771530
MDREKEREIELESAMYTNCLLLGLDPSIIGIQPGSNSTPRVGLFRHSNPKLGEQLLYFLLSSLRGPLQSSKDFDKVWPIFDSAQSRDFRKVVQGIIGELESQGALPRSNSRVSSLATCCGPRFVELLWQLSLHALREVHRRTFPGDIVSNPLPGSLTDVAFSHAAALLPVTKSRIALERRRFLTNAETAVQTQTMWSSLAHEMTAEYRGLCAEEAYLQQELEKLQDMRNKAKMEAEMWDERSAGSSQSSHLASKATRLWESLLSRKSQHEVLASGPIEDLIAHREHRYRISGSALLAGMDQSSQFLLGQPGDQTAVHLEEKEQNDGLSAYMTSERPRSSVDSSQSQLSEETFSRVDDRSGRSHPTVDVAEILRRWTHALQRIHKQSLQLAKANDGEGPDILRSTQEGTGNGHAESLAATLAEHRQHLASIQVLINQLKEVSPAIQKSITDLTDEANTISSGLPQINKRSGRPALPMQPQSSVKGSSKDEVSEVTSKMSNVQLEKSAASPALKLPHLFSLTPNSAGKGGNTNKSYASPANHAEKLTERKYADSGLMNNATDNPPQVADAESLYVQNLKRSVRETALSIQSCNYESSRDSHSEDGSEHFFVPVSATGFTSLDSEQRGTSIRSKRLFTSEGDSSYGSSISGSRVSKQLDDIPDVFNEFDMFSEYDPINGFLSTSASNYAASESQTSFYDLDEAPDQVFSPPLLMDSSLLADAYEDLLAPLSETDAALMEH